MITCLSYNLSFICEYLKHFFFFLSSQNAPYAYSKHFFFFFRESIHDFILKVQLLITRYLLNFSASDAEEYRCTCLIILVVGKSRGHTYELV